MIDASYSDNHLWPEYLPVINFFPTCMIQSGNHVFTATGETRDRASAIAGNRYRPSSPCAVRALSQVGRERQLQILHAISILAPVAYRPCDSAGLFKKRNNQQCRPNSSNVCQPVQHIRMAPDKVDALHKLNDSSEGS